MVDADILVHAVEIIGVFLCVHHFWPKGITYGEREAWELKNERKQHRSPNTRTRRHGHSSSRSYYGSSDSGSRGERSSSVSGHRKRRQGFYDEYNEYPRSTSGYRYDDEYDYGVGGRHHYYERGYRGDRGEVGQDRTPYEYEYSEAGSGSGDGAHYDDERNPPMKYLEYYDDEGSQARSDNSRKPRRHSRRSSSRY